MRWLRMPFGICSASEEYQRRQTQHVADLKGVEVVADDHLISGCGETTEEALVDRDNNLKNLLKRAREIRLGEDEAALHISELHVSPSNC